MFTNFATLNGRIVNALRTSDFTANQLRSRFGIESVSARISEIRKAGFAVYLNTKTTNNGRTIRVYTLSTPKRREVVAGQVALANPFLTGYALEQAVNNRLSLVS